MKVMRLALAALILGLMSCDQTVDLVGFCGAMAVSPSDTMISAGDSARFLVRFDGPDCVESIHPPYEWTVTASTILSVRADGDSAAIVKALGVGVGSVIAKAGPRVGNWGYDQGEAIVRVR